jgi:hypothetical protein
VKEGQQRCTGESVTRHPKDQHRKKGQQKMLDTEFKPRSSKVEERPADIIL